MAHPLTMIGRPVHPKCELCGDEVVYHPGNGGQWIGAHPPRDWMHCNGDPAQDAPKHVVA